MRCAPAATLCFCVSVVFADGFALHQRSPKTAVLAKSSVLFKSWRRVCFCSANVSVLVDFDKHTRNPLKNLAIKNLAMC